MWIRSDLEKCFDSQLSGINNDDITEIIYCHTSSGIDAGADKSLKRYCQDKGVQLTMIGIDKLAEDISRKYPILAKEHLGLSVDADPELFRRIPLCPTSYSWSGSAVPLYSKWADYLKGLLPLFSGIQFLQHQKVVNDEIEHLSKMIERAEIEDLLQG